MTSNAATPGAPGSADRLQADRDDAEAQLRRLEDEYAAMLADPGAIQEDRDNARTLLEAARLAFERADSALARATAGSYGECARCHRPIAPERLEALPSATTCITCEAAS